MGALHEGHLSLVEAANRAATRTVVSIFVNPRQFAPHEDFSRYPRDEEADLGKLSTVGCSLVWAPTVADLYPPGFSTRIEVGGAAMGLESDFRPHFFGGVATVCCKLFTSVAPDIAIFGEKDYQQLCVLRQLVRDLNLPVEIRGMPTVREPDGLALSSRNAYLTPQERAAAPALYRAIETVAHRVSQGEDTAIVTQSAAREILAAGFAKVDYIEVRDAATLTIPTGPHAAPLRVLAAAWLGKTRLIDNAPVPLPG
jgi:pantoate--beta-alanine ligase